MEIGRKPPTVKGPPDWFSGEAFIDGLAQAHGASPASVALVHFTPGARTAWHRPSLGQSSSSPKAKVVFKLAASRSSRFTPATRSLRQVASGTGMVRHPTTS